MKDQLTQDQKDEIRKAILNYTFTPQVEILNLIAQGYEAEMAKDLVRAEIKANKKELFDIAIKKDRQGEIRGVTVFIIFIISVIGPFFRIESPLWYIVISVLAGIGGYFAFREKPIAGVVSAMIAASVLPFAYGFYFAGRESFINIEIIFPIAMAAIPAVLAFIVISALVYRGVETD